MTACLQEGSRAWNQFHTWLAHSDANCSNPDTIISSFPPHIFPHSGQLFLRKLLPFLLLAPLSTSSQFITNFECCRQGMPHRSSLGTRNPWCLHHTMSLGWRTYCRPCNNGLQSCLKHLAGKKTFSTMLFKESEARSWESLLQCKICLWKRPFSIWEYNLPGYDRFFFLVLFYENVSSGELPNHDIWISWRSTLHKPSKICHSPEMWGAHLHPHRDNLTGAPTTISLNYHPRARIV